MKEHTAAEYYSMMINGLHGLQDDLDANEAPRQAKELLTQVCEICRADYKQRFDPNA